MCEVDKQLLLFKFVYMYCIVPLFEENVHLAIFKT